MVRELVQNGGVAGIVPVVELAHEGRFSSLQE